MLMKLNLILAVETLVLIASLFLLIHISKNQLSKWYRYAGIAIVVFVMGLMLCTMVASCRMCGKNRKSDCEMGSQRMKMKCMSAEMQSGCCAQMMHGCNGGGMDCGSGKEMGMNSGSCGMNKSSCCMMGKSEGCCDGMNKAECAAGGDSEKEECMRKCEGDSLVKKKVIIKKK